MISFKQFLTERKIRSWDVNIIDVKKAVTLLNANCKDGLKAISNGGLLYRGFKHKNAVMTIDTTNGERTSRDTNNLYQVMMDTSSELKDYPKRSHSLICSTDINEAGSYGSVMVIIPFDGTELAITNCDDFLNNIIYSKWVDDVDVDHFTDVMYVLLRNAGLPKHDQYTAKDIPTINKVLDKNATAFCENFAKQFHFQENLKKQFEKFVSENQGRVFEALCDSIFTRQTLNMRKKMFGEVLKKDVECWFAGKSIAIDVKLFAGIIHALKKGGSHIDQSIEEDFRYLFADGDMEMADDILEYIQNNLK